MSWPYARITVSMLNVARRSWLDRRGATMIEFAMVVAPFIALMLAILQTSLIYFTQQALETAVEATARQVITGQSQAGDAKGANSGLSSAQLQARFQQAACAQLPGFIKCNKLFVDVRSAGTWADLDTSLPVMTFDKNGNVTNKFSYSLGTQGAVIMVRLMYIWPLQGSPIPLSLGNMVNSANQRLIVATSVAKSETYS